MAETQRTLTDKCSFYLHTQGIVHEIAERGSGRIIKLVNMVDARGKRIAGTVTVDDCSLTLHALLDCIFVSEDAMKAYAAINAVNGKLGMGHLEYSPSTGRVIYLLNNTVAGCEVEDSEFFNIIFGAYLVEISSYNKKLDDLAAGAVGLEEFLGDLLK